MSGDRAHHVRQDYSAVSNGGHGVTQSCMDEPYYPSSDNHGAGPSRRDAGGYAVEDRYGDMLLGENHGGYQHHRPPPAPHHHDSMYPYPPAIPSADYRASLPRMMKGHSGEQALYREDEFWGPPPPPSAYPLLRSGDGDYDNTTINKTTFRKRSSYDSSEQADHKFPRID
jgi:hypothetical protein